MKKITYLYLDISIAFNNSNIPAFNKNAVIADTNIIHRQLQRQVWIFDEICILL